MINRSLFLASLSAVPLMTRPAFSASPATFAIDGIGINGADAVAYFNQSAYVAGSPDFSATWKGADWLFSTEENLALFNENPKAFAPQYGGYCAYAAAHGAIAKTVPDAWTVHEGKLYLNYSDYVRGQWLQDIPGYIALADGFWPSILEA